MNLIKLIMALCVVAAPGFAGSGQITVTGEGQVNKVPDMAVITLGISHQATTAQAAVSEVAVTAGAILAALEEMGLEPRDLRTSDLSLSPVRKSRSSSNADPKIVGFIAGNQVTARVRDLAILGRVLGRVTSEGANRFQGLRFALQDPAPALNEARVLAVIDGRARALLYADAAGVTLGPLVSISEPGTRVMPQAMTMMRAGMADMPVAEGELSLNASVTMVFAIAETAED